MAISNKPRTSPVPHMSPEIIPFIAPTVLVDNFQVVISRGSSCMLQLRGHVLHAAAKRGCLTCCS